MTDINKETIKPHETGNFESGVAHEGATEVNKSEQLDQSEQGQTEGVRGDIKKIDQSSVVETSEEVLESPLSNDQKANKLTGILNDHPTEGEFDPFAVNDEITK